MVAITWAKPQNPKLDTGVDRGVFYPTVGAGVPWNGITGVDEEFEGGEREAFHFDGVKMFDLINERTFAAIVRAFSVPREFEQAVGTVEIADGFYLTRQHGRAFSMAYRHQTSETTYKIHLIYNATARPQARGYKTISNETELTGLAYRVSAIPQSVAGFRVSAHFILDSETLDPEVLQVLESYLYGSSRSEPQLPPLQVIIDLITRNNPVRVVPSTTDGLATLAPTGYDEYDLTPSIVEGIFTALPTNRLVQSTNDPEGIYRLE